MAVELKKETIETLYRYYAEPGPSLNWPHIFALPAWLQSWWEAFGKGYTLCLRSIWQERELIGIAPMMARGGNAYLIGSSDVCDYLDFVTRPGREKAFFNALLPALRSEGFSKLVMEAQRPDSVFFCALADFNESPGFPAAVEFAREDETFTLNLPGSWEDYLALLSKKQRHEVRRKLRRLDRDTQDYRYHVIKENGAMQDFIPSFFKLLQDHPDKANFLTPQMEHYFRILIDNMARESLARIGLLEINGSNAAAVLYFNYSGCIYLYNSGFNSKYRPLSAGLLSKVFLINESIEQGSRVYDFLKGREIYKSRLGGTAVPVYRAEVTLE